MASATSSRCDERSGWVLLPVAAGAWAAAWLVVAHGPPVGAVTAAVTVSVAAGCLVAARTITCRRVCVVVLLTAAAVATSAGVTAAVTAAHIQDRHPAALTALAAEGAVVRATVRVTSDPRLVAGSRWDPAARRVLVEAALLQVSWRSTTLPEQGPALLVAGPAWSDVHLDGVYTATGVLGLPRESAAPHVATLTIRGDPVAQAAPRPAWRAAEHVRSRLRQAVAPLPGAAPGLLPSLAVGDTTGLPADLAEDMRVAGLSHLTVVSGANVTLICGGVVALLAFSGAGPRRQVIGGGLALVALVLVARPDPSVLRAAAMGGVGLLGLLIGRPGRALSALAVACTVLLWIDPWLSRSFGFGLSAAATAGIVCLARPLAHRLPGPRVIGYPLAVTMAAQVSVTPILVLLDPALATYAVPANLLAGPAVAPTMVVTTLAAVVAVVSPDVATVVAWPAAAGAAWLALLSRTVAGLPAASISWLSGGWGVAAAVALGAGAVAAVWWGPRCSAWARTTLSTLDPGATGRLARLVIAGVAVPVLLVGGSAVTGVRLPWRSAWPGPNWAVIVCDVGQGEAILVRTSASAAVVVDTGPDAAPMARCLDQAGIDSVPLLLLTHFHADHVGGVAAVLERATVEQVWHSPQASPNGSVAVVAAALAAAGVPSRAARTGDSLGIGHVGVEVLWPQRVPDPYGAAEGDGTAINDASLVVRVTRPGLSMLCLGDVELVSQAGLLATRERLRADVTTIAHHGSGVQVPALYEAIGPRLAIASAGADNDYGHPDPGAMAMVAATGSEVMSTATSGAVAIVIDGTGAVGVVPKG